MWQPPAAKHYPEHSLQSSRDRDRLTLVAKADRDLAHVIHMCNRRGMPKMIQVRNVPDRLHRELKRRARARGMTLTDYIQGILEREVARPPREEVFRRIASRTPVKLGKPAAEYIREEREEHERRRNW